MPSDTAVSVLSAVESMKNATRVTPLPFTQHEVPAFSRPLTVAPATGALNHTSSEPEPGAAVGVVVLDVGVGVGDGVGDGVSVGAGVGVGVALFCTLTLMMSVLVEPSVPVTTALSWCVPFANFVVSSAHCMPSVGALSVLRAL